MEHHGPGGVAMINRGDSKRNTPKKRGRKCRNCQLHGPGPLPVLIIAWLSFFLSNEMGIVERKGKKDFRRPKPPSKQSDGRNYGGRKKSAVESDLARGRALAAAAKEKREGNRALAKAREEKETALAKKGKTKAADSDEEEEEDQPEVEEPAETVLDDQNPDGDEDEDEGNASSTPKGRVPGKAKGGPGKKGKVFASTTDMLSIINSINSSEETKIVRKLEKRKAVHAILDEKEKKEKEKEKQKKKLLQNKKAEILEQEKKKKVSKRKVPPNEDFEEAETKKRVQFA